MKSAKNMRIEITEKAEQDLQKIDEYILSRFNRKVLLDFYNKFDVLVQNIATGKIVYQKHEDTNYHKVLITKHNTLIYHKTEDKVTIIRVINNFQSEENRKIK